MDPLWPMSRIPHFPTFFLYILSTRSYFIRKTVILQHLKNGASCTPGARPRQQAQAASTVLCVGKTVALLLRGVARCCCGLLLWFVVACCMSPLASTSFLRLVHPIVSNSTCPRHTYTQTKINHRFLITACSTIHLQHLTHGLLIIKMRVL